MRKEETMSRTLVLTPWMSPHRLIDWQDAVQDWTLGKVEILETYDEIISSAGSETNPPIVIGMPLVVRLVRGVANYKKGIKFSRVNVFTRDGFRCQYCGKQKDMNELNYDHVVPRLHGGKTTWENIATSCYPCNDRKGSRTPEQAGMRLLRKPYKPKTLPMTSHIFNIRDPHPRMAPYLDAAKGVTSTG
jgi:5-methylcytosine-specific restriction endonuclease McrA